MSKKNINEMVVVGFTDYKEDGYKIRELNLKIDAVIDQIKNVYQPRGFINATCDDGRFHLVMLNQSVHCEVDSIFTINFYKFTSGRGNIAIYFRNSVHVTLDVPKVFEYE